MFEKNMKIAYLLDFYEELLDPHVRNVMRAYYDDDLSLAEIAEGEGISRQGVRHLIKKGEDAIEFYDRNLSLADRHEELVTAGASLLGVAERLEAASLADEAAVIRRIVEVITKGNQDVPKSN